jgi:hypothetical protein
MSFDLARQQPPRQPEAVASGLVGDNNALYRAPDPRSLLSPALQEPQEFCCARFELFHWLACDARH